VNGLPHSWLPFEGIHTLLGAVPALIHPSPEEIAVIGLGSGETAWAIACRPETRSVRVFEIAASQQRLLRQVAAIAPFPSLVELLQDPRLRIEAADGRRALQREDRRYDLIEVDALYLTSAGSGNLYSIEFFEECARKLKPGGHRLLAEAEPARGAQLRRGAPARGGLRQHGGRAATSRSRSTSPPGSPGSQARRSRAASTPPARSESRTALFRLAGRPQPDGPRRLQPRPVPARRVRHAGGLVTKGVRS
jgi:SAM-dependent methyltransferase